MAGEWPAIEFVVVRPRRPRRRRRRSPSRSSAGRSASTFSRCPSGSWPPGWLLQLAILVFAVALFFFVTWRGTPHPARPWLRRVTVPPAGWRWPGRWCSWRSPRETYLGRFERLFDEHPIFSGVTYTDAHVTLTGALAGRGRAACSARWSPRSPASSAPRVRWLILSAVPALLPLHRHRRRRRPTSKASSSSRTSWCGEQPFITHNIELTRQAFGLDRIARRPFPAETGVRGRRRAEQPGDAAEHPLVGLARAAGHAASAPGDPHLLRLSRTSTSIAT